MLKAVPFYHSTPAPRTGFSSLSSLFRDPALRRAFERAERDDGQAFALPPPKPAPINGGAVKVLEDA